MKNKKVLMEWYQNAVLELLESVSKKFELDLKGKAELQLALEDVSKVGIAQHYESELRRIAAERAQLAEHEAQVKDLMAREESEYESSDEDSDGADRS